MGSKSKSLPLLIILILTASCVIAVKPASAQSIPTPSVPQFTVQIVDNPYFVPQTNLTDPYTGQVTIYPSHTEENKSVVVTVKNQQFVSSQIADGNWTRLYYNLRFEGHFIQNDWTYYPLAPESGYINASQSDYTVISIPRWLLAPTYSNGTQIDFQVQALIGYDESRYAVSGNTGELYSIGNRFTGQSSDWSPSQTLVFGETANSSPTPTVPEFSIVVILPLFATMFLMAFKLLRRKQLSKSL